MRRFLITIVLAFIITISASQILLYTSGSLSEHGQPESNPQITNELKQTSKELMKTDYDENCNKIHDSLEKTPRIKQPVLVTYDDLPTDIDVAGLDKYGVGIYYKCRYVNVIVTEEISFSIMERIAGLPGVNFISPEPVLKPHLDLSAPAVKARESQEYSPNTAWELGYSGNGITIAILDTGVDDGHPSLAGKFIAGVDFAGATGRVTTKDGSYNPDDEIGHGTSTAGTAMGTGGNDGVYMGMAPEARLIDVRITLGRGGSILAGLDWCLDNVNTDWNSNGPDDYDGIDIVSISIGGSDDADGTSATSQVINQLADAGVVVVTSMGNDGPNNQGVNDVAAADKVIAVGNIDIHNTIDRSDDTVDPTSSRGPRRDDGDEDPYDELKPDVVAPGIDITAPRFSAVGQSGNGYDTNSGSSLSCPHVSGICALMLEANPNLRPREIKKILQETAEAMGEPDVPELSDKYNYASGYGSVDAYEAVKSAQSYVPSNRRPEIQSVTASPKFVEPNGQSTIKTVANDPDGDSLVYQYYASNGTIEGTGSEVTWNAPNELGQYEITVTVNDGVISSNPVSVTVTVEDDPGNHPPEIDLIEVEPLVVEPNDSSTIRVTASDPDDDKIFYEYTTTGGVISGSGKQVTWTAPSTNGKYTISITVNDGELFSDTEKVIITVEGGADNKPPEIESFTANTRSIRIGGIVKLTVSAIDPELDELTYTYTPTGGEITGTGPNVDWNAPDVPDTYVIEVTVMDIEGLSDFEDILIEVFQPNTPPAILETHANPASIKNDGSAEVLFTVSVADLNGLEDISKVTVDLSTIAGDATQKMYDNGKHGDRAKDDGVFSYTYLVPNGVSGGLKELPVSVQDNSEESASLFIVLEVKAVSGDSGDEGLFGGYLPLPGFEGLWIILVLAFIVLICSRGRFESRKRDF